MSIRETEDDFSYQNFLWIWTNKTARQEGGEYDTQDGLI